MHALKSVRENVELMSTEVCGIADGNQMRIKLSYCILVVLVYREIGCLCLRENEVLLKGQRMIDLVGKNSLSYDIYEENLVVLA